MTAKALGKLQDALTGAKAPSAPAPAPRPAMSAGVSRNELLQNASITAQVCIKAAATIAANTESANPEITEEFASNMARRFMDDAAEYVGAVMEGKAKRFKMRRKTKVKEPKS